MTDINHGTIIEPKDFTPAPFYKWFIPGKQIASSGTEGIDRSGNSHNAVAGGTLAAADMWAGGWMNAAAVTANCPSIIGTAFPWDMNSADGSNNSFIMAGWLKCGSAVGDGLAGAKATSTTPGIRLWQAAGVVWARVGDTTAEINDATMGMAIADDTFHHFVVAIDGATKSLYYWADGVSTGAGTDLASKTESTLNAGRFCYGADADTGVVPIASGWKDLHMLMFDNGLPSNMSEIVNLLYTRGNYQLRSAEIDHA